MEKCTECKSEDVVVTNRTFGYAYCQECFDNMIQQHIKNTENISK